MPATRRQRLDAYVHDYWGLRLDAITLGSFALFCWLVRILYRDMRHAD